MSDMQSPPAGPIDEGFVHDVDVALELPPEPPPTGPWVWVQQNLISGATPGARLFNGFLTVAFAVIALNVLQFITSYFFSPERRWGGVTANMKLLMVQAFPNDDLERIWISVGIVMVLIAWSLVSFEAGGKISAYMLATRARSIGVFLLLVTILHSGDGASSIGIPLAPRPRSSRLVERCTMGRFSNCARSRSARVPDAEHVWRPGQRDGNPVCGDVPGGHGDHHRGTERDRAPVPQRSVHGCICSDCRFDDSGLVDSVCRDRGCLFRRQGDTSSNARSIPPGLARSFRGKLSDHHHGDSAQSGVDMERHS